MRSIYSVQRRKKKYALLFMMPLLLTFGIFNLFPSIMGIYAAFTKWTLGRSPVWIGMQNLRTLFLDDASMYYWQFRWGLKNTLIFVVLTVPLRIVVPLVLALCLQSHCKGYKLFSAVYYLPSLFSLAVVMSSWNFMFDTNYGLINAVLNLGKFSWTNTVPYNWIAMVIISVWWGTGGNMIIYQSALAGVPQEIIESARMDGANSIQRFRYITIPMIKYPISYTFTTTLIAEFNVWGQPMMFNKGGNTVRMVNGFAETANTVLMQYIRDLGFGNASTNPGMASAMALILGMIIIVFSMMQIRLMQQNS